MNTTAFKSQTATFSSLFYQNLGTTGSGDALQEGLGTQVAGTSTNFTGGSLNKTTTSTDMAINGSGYFVVQRDGQQELTRAGNFQLDSSGNLITSAGLNVMGYAGANGVVNTNTPLAALQVPVNATQAASATSKFSLAANLNASTAVGGQFSTTVKMFDSLGTSHAATVTFTRATVGTGTTDSTWTYAITLPAGDQATVNTVANTTGTLSFLPSGALDTTPAVLPNTTGITFNNMSDGATSMSFNWNLSDSSGPLIEQTVGTSTVNSGTQDGFASGSYSSFSVDASGIISATFSNGNTEKVGELAIASVTNSEGLELAGGNNYTTTQASGAASVGAPGAGGRGSVEDDTLEASNVDISTEFADLIVAQRAFEANSKTVTTFDTVTQETINMIH